MSPILEVIYDLGANCACLALPICEVQVAFRPVRATLYSTYNAYHLGLCRSHDFCYKYDKAAGPATLCQQLLATFRNHFYMYMLFFFDAIVHYAKNTNHNMVEMVLRKSSIWLLLTEPKLHSLFFNLILPTLRGTL